MDQYQQYGSVENASMLMFCYPLWKAKLSKAKQSKAEQSKAKQSKTKLSKAKQS